MARRLHRRERNYTPSEGDLYLLEATWQNDAGKYEKRCIFTRATRVEELFESLAKEHPEWDAVKSPYDWGNINPTRGTTSVCVYKVETCDNTSWGMWVEEQRTNYARTLKQRKRARDMKELRRIVDEWDIAPLEALAIAAGTDELEGDQR